MTIHETRHEILKPQTVSRDQTLTALREDDGQLRERRLEVEDDDTELIDMTIQECNRLLDLRCFLGR